MVLGALIALLAAARRGCTWGCTGWPTWSAACSSERYGPWSWSRHGTRLCAQATHTAARADRPRTHRD